VSAPDLTGRAEARTTRLEWRAATVLETFSETPRTRTLVLDVSDWPGHRAGQHVDVRLTADDGYQAQRSYSIASAPEDSHLAMTIERLEDGEVSPYLAGALEAGDRFELRGPIGGHFVWDVSLGGPLVLIAGGSGIVPLMAMLRHRAHAPDARRAEVPATLLYSSRSWIEVIYRDELARLAIDPHVSVVHTLTRSAPPDWLGYRRRFDRQILAAELPPPAEKPHVFICGSTPIVEAMASIMVDMGYDAASVKTERFGPTG
jgi:ferredoxin-NADP reductase